MKYDPDKHDRKSIRLKGYDYGQSGAYFITICTQARVRMFGDVVDGLMDLDDVGRIVVQCWNGLPNHYSHVGLDAFVVMPNHVHGIIVISEEMNQATWMGLKPATTQSEITRQHGLPEIVRGFKTFSARYVNHAFGTLGRRLWQRGYYEHIIRNENQLDGIREYIMSNPLNWQEDPENQQSVKNRSRQVQGTGLALG